MARLQSSNVTAVFRDGAQSFALMHGATLVDLATKIDSLGDSHDGVPLAVRIQFAGLPPRRIATAPSSATIKGANDPAFHLPPRQSVRNRS